MFSKNLINETYSFVGEKRGTDWHRGFPAHYKMHQTAKEREEEPCLGYIQAIVTQPPYSYRGVKGCVRSSLPGSVFSESWVFFPLNLPRVSNQTTCKSS